MSHITNLVNACRVPAFAHPPEDVRREKGPWYIEHFVRKDRQFGHHLGRFESVTGLFRWTNGTLHHHWGECVMDDGEKELRRHLPILLAAHGHVLVSGLGLGCVLRGLLTKPDVEHVTVIEIDPCIIELVAAEWWTNPRVTLLVGNAETIKLWRHDRWDFAWHDVWSETEGLSVLHARLMARYSDRVRVAQGAWMFPRDVRRVWQSKIVLLGAKRRLARRYRLA